MINARASDVRALLAPQRYFCCNLSGGMSAGASQRPAPSSLNVPDCNKYGYAPGAQGFQHAKQASAWPTMPAVEATAPAAAPESSNSCVATPVPLKLVVADAVKRWFEDTYNDAQRGDVKQQALLAQMYAEGYGCECDPKAAKEWAEKARSKGYRMRGVYCDL